ncbi:uncharacterized protein LY79DRAFT_203789 [Colletotrichum navitas]|uniref:Uncharacterized protein n=1 Tax=Colletotrichum navitas TaxID=681940 RepID=A0AAD8QA99_9PEZI|nr:uncharacterized protein LY79DRAFT_203789 [Colletotrichum navitas]KAK1598920.1 hypothetical protein LY79DRAFT_203789 [Colletotrichum navitas]
MRTREKTSRDKLCLTSGRTANAEYFSSNTVSLGQKTKQETNPLKKKKRKKKERKNLEHPSSRNRCPPKNPHAGNLQHFIPARCVAHICPPGGGSHVHPSIRHPSSAARPSVSRSHRRSLPHTPAPCIRICKTTIANASFRFSEFQVAHVIPANLPEPSVTRVPYASLPGGEEAVPHPAPPGLGIRLV